MSKQSGYQQVSISVLAIGLLALSVMLTPAWQAKVSTNTQQCEQMLKSAEENTLAKQCKATEEGVSWFSWFTGQSRSSQFHFIDLLELIIGERNASQDTTSKENDPVRVIS